MWLTRKALSVCSALFLSSSHAFAVEGELGLEWRMFSESGLYGQDMSQVSAFAELGDSGTVASGDYELLLFGRYDKEDSDRSHADVREASWTFVGDEWSIKAGVSKEFWGVAESRHLVDVINQTDGVEGVDGEDKLGQPMVKLSSEKEWGTIDAYFLPYFRERSLPSLDGRLTLPLKLQTDNAQYESGAKEHHGDVALRYSHYIDELEFALSHFSGTGRQPLLQFNGSLSAPAYIPFYEQVDQTGLELQYIYDAWLLKFEGITNKGIGRRYSSAVAGFEYTQVGIFDSSADLGWIAEYMFDDRKSDPTAYFEQDIFVGWRYAFNDADSSEVLLGGIFDPKTEENVYSLEASKRLASDLKLRFEAWVFDGKPNLTPDLPTLLASNHNEKTRFLQSEDFLQIEVVKYF